MNLLQITDEDKNFVRKIYNVTEKDIERDVGILKEWLKKQPQLPQNVQDDEFFEHVLIRNKCRVEKAKECIDNYYTLKTVCPELYEKVETLVPSKMSVRCIPIVPLNKNKERIYICNFSSSRAIDYNFRDGADISIANFELLMKHEYAAAVRFVIDLQYFSFEHIKKILPSVLFKVQKACLGAYSYRIAGFHFYKPPSVISSIMAIIKTVLPQKLYNRISMHSNLESLKEVISEDLLPRDYGGNQKSIDELLEEWDRIFDDNRKILINAVKLKSNESLREGSISYGTELFGADGTFKKLNLD